MKNKGFTLVELLGVIIILALLMLIVFPKIINSIKTSSDEVDELTMKLISSASDLYINDYQKDFPKLDGAKYCIELKLLVDKDLLKAPITLSDSDMDITDLKSVEVIYKDGYNYKLVNKDICQRTVDGIDTVHLKDATLANLMDYKIYGNSIQNGIPSSTNPIKIESLGLYDEATGKYKIDIKVEDGTIETITNIYLDEPLRKLGDIADYIDYKNQKIFRYIEVLDDTGTLSIEDSYSVILDDQGTSIDLPPIKVTNKDVYITVQGASKIEVIY